MSITCENGTCQRNVGCYSEFREADETSRNVLSNSFNLLSNSTVSHLSLEHLHANHTYSRQTVAGTNYKFRVKHESGCHVVTVWHKLDNTYNVTSVEQCQDC
jgi:hypothetical protein